jgi:hypothetical protein
MLTKSSFNLVPLAAIASSNPQSLPQRPTSRPHDWTLLRGLADVLHSLRDLRQLALDRSLMQPIKRAGRLILRLPSRMQQS